MKNEDIKFDNEKRTVCEVWTRVMGYFRPVSAFNKGKQSEYSERKYFKTERRGCCCNKE
ncbi:MAG: anaerobic ribonucleoside-triphosphate reductase [Holosporales bacterium]|nr:anaerobic ribonucleoside-triphosphate reductase [Holosporales bacterium]